MSEGKYRNQQHRTAFIVPTGRSDHSCLYEGVQLTEESRIHQPVHVDYKAIQHTAVGMDPVFNSLTLPVDRPKISFEVILQFSGMSLQVKDISSRKLEKALLHVGPVQRHIVPVYHSAARYICAIKGCCTICADALRLRLSVVLLQQAIFLMLLVCCDMTLDHKGFKSRNRFSNRSKQALPLDSETNS
mgnify:CR=1 FL=1